MKIITKVIAALIAALAIFSTASNAVAQSGYPDRAVRMILGYPPAGPVDIIARIMADRLSQIWGQPAPETFSTTTGWPQIWLSLSAMIRAMMSTGPAGG